MHQDRKFKTAASLVTTIALSVLLFLLFFSIELLTGQLNPKLFLDSLRASDYGVKMEQEMLEKQRALFSSNGLPESLIEEIWEENDVYLAFYKYIDGGAALDGDLGQETVIENYLKQQGVKETDSVKRAARIVAEESEAICRRYVYPSFVSGFRQFAEGRRNALLATGAVSALLAIALTAFLANLHEKRRHALRYVTGSFFAAAVWNAAALLVALDKGQARISDGASAGYQEFLKLYQARSLAPWYIVSIAACVAAVILLLANLRMRKR